MTMQIRFAVTSLFVIAIAGCSNGGDSLGSPGSGSAGSGTSGIPPSPEAKGCAAAAANFNQLAGDGADKETKGAFTVPFCEEKFLNDYPDAEIPDRGVGSGGIVNPLLPSYSNLEHCARRSENKFYECKPAAGSIALLPDNRMVYFNALESLENGELNVFKEGGDITVNDQTRVLGLGNNGVAFWSRPINNDAGAVNPVIQPGGGTILPVLGNINPGQTPDDAAVNDGALFCAHLVNLYDGRVLAAGGTDFYTELGLVELEGLKNTRIFNPANNTWTQADPMSWGRWYPTLTTLANGNLFVVSGVRKLVKPVYLDRPQDSGRNETHSEIFQPGCNDGKGKWTDNGESGRKSLPLFPRMHLLPNNQVLYTAAGQAYNPFGEAYDEVLWYFMSAYDPATNTWTDLGIPGTPISGGLPFAIPELPGAPLPGVPALPVPVPDAPALPGVPAAAPLPGVPGLPAGGLPAAPALPIGIADLLAPITNNLPIGFGFRGSTTNVMLPLVPDASGNYNTAEFLTMGGVILPTPGSYFPIAQSRVDTLSLAGGAMTLSSRDVGPLNKARWYGQGVLLPSGQVMLFSGADADEVIQPGLGATIMEPEMYDPATGTWSVMAKQGKARTYHNTAFLLPDARVMVSGHAPISAGYALNMDIPTRSPQGRDPSFEIYSPPYIFKTRPTINSLSTRVVAPGSTLTVSTLDASGIASGGYVVLVRRTAITHLVDGDQRNVVLKVESSSANSVTVRIPSNDPAKNQAVVPPGHYMLFVVNKSGNDLVPSVSAPVQITGADLTCR